MIEDILGWALLALIPLSFIGIFYGIKKYVAYRHKKQQDEMDLWLKETSERAERLRTAERKRQQDVASSYASVPKSKATGPSGSAGYSTTSSTASQPASNWSDDLLTTMIVTDTISNVLNAVSHHSESSGSSSSSSWGLDDSDSRKSVLSTFDTSSSWSSDSSSSSDSGPSSDW